ncbi:hypothetical protein A2U01_0022821 [Trifolium medium]|uniref:Uncharacterized protein n=1 Tax=Trifolium medium TaxID=97028 RepID=A0A392NQW3_9FABA|nr:hypothetical protein [Trifolium medium]
MIETLIVGVASRVQSASNRVSMGETLGLSEALEELERVKLTQVTIEMDVMEIVMAMLDKKVH